MAFDAAGYAEAMGKFILKMEKIPDLIHPGTQEAMEDLCKSLRIAKVEAVFYEMLEHEEQKWGGKAVFYQGAECEQEQACHFRQHTEEGNLIEYVIFPIQGGGCWEEQEQERIQVFVTMLFTFHRRIHIKQIVENLTFRDQEFGMYNLAWFKRQTNLLISQGEIDKYAACYFNLRHFSVVNQQIGRERGSAVMGKFIGKLQDKLVDPEIVCRMDGDNFIILFLKSNLDMIMDYLKGVGVVYDEKENKRVWVGAYAGYYMIPKNCESVVSILERLGMAIHIARNVRKTEYVFFDEELMQGVRAGKTIEMILPEAIKREEFQVYYQPKILLEDYRLVGAEALCRWIQDGKIVPPGEFVPILEQSGLICLLDYYMLEHVCQDIRRWLDDGRRVVTVSVNLSRAHMSDMDLLDHLLEIIDRYQVPHKYIEIELTETGTEVDFKHLKALVSGLRKQGIRTSVDDFGTGYSSMDLIRELPWSMIKIDKSFLPVKMEEDEQKCIMIKHLIAMAHAMDKECIVEGVETAEQVELLKESNCFLAQGYYFDKPLPVQVFEEKLMEI
ncbi:MAG: GGDEF domain-containing protein [Lachnospiraceae bacterium]|nr:GGDEF domain-containing protein [Lachnospiraceae bacterium]